MTSIMQRMQRNHILFALILIVILGIFTTYYFRQSQGSDWELYFKNSQRSSHDDGVYMIPNDARLDGYNVKELTRIYWRYINNLQILCRDQTRVGRLTDGGKEVCLDKPFRPNAPCLVYSFGSNGAYDFEHGINELFKCEIHTFDPTMLTREVISPPFLRFHSVGLGSKDITYNKQFHIRRLETIIKALGHEQRTIDILKIDIEGWEWIAIPDMAQSGVLSNVRQLFLETHVGIENKQIRIGMQSVLRALISPGDPGVHYDPSISRSPHRPHKVLSKSSVYRYGDVKQVKLNMLNPVRDLYASQLGSMAPTFENWGMVSMATQVKGLGKLYDQGFRIFMRDRNLGQIFPFDSPHRFITRVNEISLVNVRYLSNS